MTPQTKARRAAEAFQNAQDAPFQAMTDAELAREHNRTRHIRATREIMARVNTKRIAINYDGFDNGIDAAIAAFKAQA